MKRFQTKSLKGIKFYHKNGHTRGMNWGIFDSQKGEFVSDEGKNHPWDYDSKSTVNQIVKVFNNEGPCGELNYATRL